MQSFPSATDSTDPSSQIPWPARRSAGDSDVPAPSEGDPTAAPPARANGQAERSVSATPSHRQMSAWHLFTLSVSMGGTQMAWIVELAYGTPFLVDLGISEQMTSLVWLAGPISGLVAQPLIGAISDSSTSKFRRRKWVIWSTAVVAVSIVLLSYTKLIAVIIIDTLGVGEGDWDPKRDERVKGTAIAIAILSFYLLDFALNGLQASLRNLLLDVTPAEQLNQANAWHGRMNHAGSILGNGFGFINLASWPLLRLLGGDQFRKFSAVVLVILVATVWITCFTHKEPERPEEFRHPSRSSMFSIFRQIYDAIKSLPKPIKRVCFVQLFAWMGWFPFLFYSTLWMGEVMARELNLDPDKDSATRAGEFALFLYSITAAVFGWLLPLLTKRDRRLLVFEESQVAQGEDEETVRIRDLIRSWKAQGARQGKKLLLPAMPFMLRNIWTAALLLFAIIMFLMVFVRSVVQATILIAALGICWSVAMWVPFAIIMEYLKAREVPGVEPRPIAPPPRNIRRQSLPTPSWRAQQRSSERSPLVRARSHVLDPEEIEEANAPVAGGTILGIHNLAVVIPQFIIALMSSVIFKIVDGHEAGTEDHLYLGKNGVTWVLALGGACSVIAAILSRRVPPTKPEREIRQRLAEIREAEEHGLS